MRNYDSLVTVTSNNLTMFGCFKVFMPRPFHQRKALEAGGVLLIFDLDGHLCLGHHVLAQPNLGEAALSNGVSCS